MVAEHLRNAEKHKETLKKENEVWKEAVVLADYLVPLPFPSLRSEVAGEASSRPARGGPHHYDFDEFISMCISISLSETNMQSRYENELIKGLLTSTTTRTGQ